MQVYIEITPFSSVKYEICKTTGYLRVDRPQRSSAQPPALYGFMPRTYCGTRVGMLSPKAKKGDGDHHAWRGVGRDTILNALRNAIPEMIASAAG